jgi:hypothetical protein
MGENLSREVEIPVKDREGLMYDMYGEQMSISWHGQKIRLSQSPEYLIFSR